MNVFKGIFLAALIILGGGYWYHSTGPEYALKELKEALENRDKKEVLNRIDLEKIKSALAQEYIESEELTLVEEEKLVRKIDEFANVAIEAYFLPQMIRNRTPYANSNVKIENIDKLDKSGGISLMRIDLRFSGGHKKKSVEVEMIKTPDGWKVIKITGLKKEIERFLKI